MSYLNRNERILHRIERFDRKIGKRYVKRKEKKMVEQKFNFLNTQNGCHLNGHFISFIIRVYPEIQSVFNVQRLKTNTKLFANDART